MSTKKVMTKDERREAALKTAVQLARKCGARRVSVAAVAAKHGVTAPLLFHIFESREGFTKAIVKAAKAQGVVLPEAAPTVREIREANHKKLKKLAPPKAPVKKLAALLSPKVIKTGKITPARKLPINVVKAIKNKEAAAAAAVPTPAGRKPLTLEQKQAKALRDRARRTTPVAPAPSTAASKFASLPKPFEVAMQQVAPA